MRSRAEHAAMVGYSFLVTDGPDIGRTFTLARGVTILGRLDVAASDDPPESFRWTLTDPAISRTHAQITWSGESAPVLIHLSTTNATLLNGRIVTGQSLSDGQSLGHQQSLRLGQTTLVVQEVVMVAGWTALEGHGAVGFDDDSVWGPYGITLSVDSDRASVVLNESTTEAYLLRRISGTLWSTPLRPSASISLLSGDILRVEERRFVIACPEG